MPTENPNATIVPGKMRSDREELPEGFTKEEADRAEIREYELQQRQNAAARGPAPGPGCQQYWPSDKWVCGAIRDKYNSLGAQFSFLLWPTSDELTSPDGHGKFSTFQNGPIYWSAAGGAHPVVNSFLNRWGVHGYETGWMGYPTTDEIVHADGIGRRQEFQNGAIYVSLPNAIGSSIGGAIRDKWNAVGAETPGSLLGYPISDEIPLPDGQGRMNRFERGVIYWHPDTGAHPVTGGFLDRWTMSGFEQGSWGYPKGDEVGSGATASQEFQYATMNRPETNPLAVDDGDIDWLTVLGNRPTTIMEYAADALDGIINPNSGSSRSADAGAPERSAAPEAMARASTPCEEDTSCIEDDDPERPRIDDNDFNQGYAIGPECKAQPLDAQPRGTRKNACVAFPQRIDVVSAQTGKVTGKLPFDMYIGGLTSHKDGGFMQEYRLVFGQHSGVVGGITIKSGFLRDGANSGYTVDYGPADGDIVYANSTMNFQVHFAERAMADRAVEARSGMIKLQFGNAHPGFLLTQWRQVGLNQRCDTTMKSSNGTFRQGCVYPTITPGWDLTGSDGAADPQATGHIAKAIASGLPGGSKNNPLHRQTSVGFRNANRAEACPRYGPVYNGRKRTDYSCDEYPFASTAEGSATNAGNGRTHPGCFVPDLSSGSGANGYSVCMIDDDQNKHSGSLLGSFYGKNRVLDQDPFFVKTP
ncbi:NucA/NucB deoxyribonuclease domain-containing protein [Rhodococcus erythropolis]|uniref:NucA/NucB deoxyribonuclease domain-containing protein n=1 Tax=Rhodococcus erythropolis TaxID=1833 RepID=UPI0036D99D1B